MSILGEENNLTSVAAYGKMTYRHCLFLCYFGMWSPRLVIPRDFLFLSLVVVYVVIILGTLKASCAGVYVWPGM